MSDDNNGPAEDVEPTNESPETLAALSQFASLLTKTAAARNPVEEAAIDLSPEARAALAEFANLIGDQALPREEADQTKSGKTDP
jgi:hypothetical protein